MTWKTKLRTEEAGHDRSGRAVWELIDPLVWDSWVVPAGFRTNYVSVPRMPFVFLLAGDRAHKPATHHDWHYTIHDISREEADNLFLEMLLAEPLLERGLAHSMFKAVRWFGASSWEDETNILQRDDIRSVWELT